MSAPWRSMVSADRWKLNLCPADRGELYDLDQDPYEMTNRFDDPNERGRIREMVGKIQQWQESVDDEVRLPALEAL